jgi:hypothetical protein
VAATRALDRGAEVAFVDNRAEAVGGGMDLATAFNRTIDLALSRGSTR